MNTSVQGGETTEIPQEIRTTDDLGNAQNRSELSNVEIRKRAWGLFKANYRALLPIMALVALFNVLSTVADVLLPDINWLSTIIGILVIPVTGVGLAWVGYNVWRENTANLSMLFAFTSPWKRFWKSVGLGLFLELSLIVPLLVPMLLGVWTGSAGVLYLLLAVSMILIFWLSWRLSIVYYVLVAQPELAFSQALGRGFRATKGNVGRIVGMIFATRWPVFVVTVAAALINRLSGTQFDWRDILMFALTVFYMGYVEIATAGLAAELLKEDARDA